MNIKKNILETIGNTPLIQLNKITKSLPCTVLAKVDYFNPGNSIKDRMALKMVEVAEKEGKLIPGGTIIECTSGNTGMGLALAAIVKGYKCIFTTTDKQSKEKIDILKAVGAEVIVCPTNVEPDDPRSYYSVARRLSKEIPNAFLCNQYDNLANRLAHYESTGPEIWEQTDGKITHLVCTAGTGGTVTGTAMYLKEKNPNIKIWAIDVYGSLLTKYFQTGEKDMGEVYPYISEGFGEDFVPENYDMSVIDHFEQVTDKDGAVMARRIAKEETFKDIISSRGAKQKLIAVQTHQTVSDAVTLMQKYEIEHIPVMNENEIVGSISENGLFQKIFKEPEVKNASIQSVLEKAYPLVEFNSPLEKISTLINKENGAVLSKDEGGNYHIITKYDILQSLTK